MTPAYLQRGCSRQVCVEGGESLGQELGIRDTQRVIRRQEFKGHLLVTVCEPTLAVSRKSHLCSPTTCGAMLANTASALLGRYPDPAPYPAPDPSDPPLALGPNPSCTALTTTATTRLPRLAPDPLDEAPPPAPPRPDDDANDKAPPTPLPATAASACSLYQVAWPCASGVLCTACISGTSWLSSRSSTCSRGAAVMKWGQEQDRADPVDSVDPRRLVGREGEDQVFRHLTALTASSKTAADFWQQERGESCRLG